MGTVGGGGGNTFARGTGQSDLSLMDGKGLCGLSVRVAVAFDQFVVAAAAVVFAHTDPTKRFCKKTQSQ